MFQALWSVGIFAADRAVAAGVLILHLRRGFYVRPAGRIGLFLPFSNDDAEQLAAALEDVIDVRAPLLQRSSR